MSVFERTFDSYAVSLCRESGPVFLWCFCDVSIKAAKQVCEYY